MTSAGLSYQQAHRSHDVRFLLARWKKAAKQAGLRECLLGKTSSGLPVAAYASQKGERNRLYVSAGVHGDEPAAVVGLLEWVEANALRLRKAKLMLLPIFNPDGLAANTRANGDGIDLNRHFHDAKQPIIAAWQTLVSGWQFDLGIMLHEDYDAQGVYCYELSEKAGLAEPLLRQVESILPRDPRSKIDGRTAKSGIIQRKNPPLDLPGLPEAIALYRTGAAATLTFETPSEFALYDRVLAHRHFVEAVANSLGI